MQSHLDQTGSEASALTPPDLDTPEPMDDSFEGDMSDMIPPPTKNDGSENIG